MPRDEGEWSKVVSGASMSQSLSLYLHFPCFDGVISAVLVSEYLQRTRDWKTDEIIPVNYDQSLNWLKKPLQQNAVVVDFLYHPKAIFWADHHGTSFLSDELEADYKIKQSPDFLYDASAQSCAQLLWSKMYRKLREPRFREMVFWANRIDSARYTSAQEAVLGDDAALRINLSLLSDSSSDYCRFLVNSLRENSLGDVAKTKDVSERDKHSRQAVLRGQKLFGKESRLEEDGIVVYKVNETPADTLISRYAPYLAYPKARYSIGFTPFKNGVKVTAMRNPWRRFASRPLGQIFQKYGGGGHQRVGSLLLKKKSDANATLDAILNDIRNPSPHRKKRRGDD